jgi:hypothetical protein
VDQLLAESGFKGADPVSAILNAASPPVEKQGNDAAVQAPGEI